MYYAIRLSSLPFTRYAWIHICSHLWGRYLTQIQDGFLVHVCPVLKKQSHRVTIPVKNHLMINHESEITLLLVSLAAIYVIKRSFESQQKEAKKNTKNRQKIEGFLRRQEFILKSDKTLYRNYILSMPALIYAESTELLAKSCILVYY